jgi:hypothetical protein
MQRKLTMVSQWLLQNESSGARDAKPLDYTNNQ